MNRRGIIVLLGAIVVLLALNLMAIEPRDDTKPMVTVPKRCVGITSQPLPDGAGPGGQRCYLFRAFEDGTVEFLRVDGTFSTPARPEQWRPLSGPAAAGKAQVP